MSKLFGVLFVLFFSIDVFASLNEVDKAFIEYRNILGNPGFEAGRARWIVTDPADVSVVTGGSELLFGNTSLTWDSNGSGETFCSRDITIPNGMYGKPGLAKITLQSGGSPTHSIYVNDGTSNIASASVSVNASPTESFVTFTFPSSGTLRLCLETIAADEPSITMDSAYLGENYKIFDFTSSSDNEFSAKISAAGVVTDENVDWINGNCTIDGTPTFNCDVSGLSLTTAMNCTGVYVTSATGNRGFWKIRTDTHTASNVSFGINGDGSGTQLTNDSYIFCQKAGADFVSTDATVKAYKADRLAKTFVARHSNDCDFTNTGSTPDKMTGDAACTFEVVKNTRFGSITSALNGGLNTAGIVINPGVTGQVEICVSWNFTGSSNQLPSWYLTDGFTNQGHGSVRVQTNQNGSAHSLTTCGTFDVVKGSTTEVNIFGGVGTGTFAIGPGTSDNTMTWTGKLVNVNFPAPYITGSVSTDSDTVDVIVGGTVATTCSSDPCTVSSQTGISGVARSAIGTYTVTFDQAFTSAPYYCISSALKVLANNRHCDISGAPTTTSFVVKCQDSGFTDQDDAFTFSCMGPR